LHSHTSPHNIDATRMGRWSVIFSIGSGVNCRANPFADALVSITNTSGTKDKHRWLHQDRGTCDWLRLVEAGWPLPSGLGWFPGLGSSILYLGSGCARATGASPTAPHAELTRLNTMKEMEPPNKLFVWDMTARAK
jgi:hypothetical protein